MVTAIPLRNFEANPISSGPGSNTLAYDSNSAVFRMAAVKAPSHQSRIGIQ